MAWTWYAQMEPRQPTSPKPPPQPSHPHSRAFSTSPFIHPLSQYAFPSAQSSIVASKASQTPHTHTQWWEADKPGKQTSHSPMVHIMFPDLTAPDVSFPKLTQPQKSLKKTGSQSKLSLPKWEDGQREAQGRGVSKGHALNIKRSKQRNRRKQSSVMYAGI